MRAPAHSTRVEPFSTCRPSPLMTRSYIRVIVIWAITLMALYAVQEYFS
jgi:hypothetical protein